MEPNIAQPTQPVTPEVQASITQPIQPTPNLPSSKTKYILLAVLILLILLVVGGGAYYLGAAKQQSTSPKNNNLTTITVSPSLNPTNISSPTSTATIDEAKQVLSGFQDTLKTHSTITAFQYTHWTLVDGSDTFIKGFSFSLAAQSYGTQGSTGYVDKYKIIPQSKDNLGNTVWDPASILIAINELKDKSDAYFLVNGFKVNTANSNESNSQQVQTVNGFVNNGISITKAYEKNGLFCVTQLNQSIYTYAAFSCGIVDDAQNKLQNTIGKELQPLFNPTNDPNTEILVQKVVGDFVLGGVGGKNGGGGAGFYAKKINGVWTKILETQNGLPCSLAQKYEMPPEFSKDCIQGQ